jgi:hypothetical protein
MILQNSSSDILMAIIHLPLFSFSQSRWKFSMPCLSAYIVDYIHLLLSGFNPIAFYESRSASLRDPDYELDPSALQYPFAFLTHTHRFESDVPTTRSEVGGVYEGGS